MDQAGKQRKGRATIRPHEPRPDAFCGRDRQPDGIYEIRELSRAEGQKSLHTKTILNWKTLRKEALRKEAPAKDRDNLKHGVKVDYTVALALGERDGYTVLFGGDIPKSDASACRWCGKYDDPSFIVLTETKFSFAVYLFGIGTLLTGPGLKKNTCDNALTMTSPVHW